MKFVVKGAELSNATSKVVKAISTKSPNPILEGIKLSVVGDELTLTATGTEITIEKTIPVSTFTEGETVVPGKFFSDFIKKLENEEEIVLNLEEGELKILYSSSEFSISIMNVEEFPLINKNIKEKSFTMKQKDFKDLINKTIFACSQTAHNSSRVDGCYLEFDDDKICAVATDTGRIAINKKKIEQSSGNFSVIVSPRTLKEIVSILDKEDDLFTLIVQKNVVMCEVEGTVLISSLLDGNNIDYKNIISNNFKSEIKVKKDSFLKALERASVVATDFNKIVKFDVTEDYVNVLAKSEIGKVNETVQIELEGKDIEISFFFKYIVEGIKAIDDEVFKICFNSSIEPCVIKPFSGDDYLHLIVPVRKNV